MSRKRPSGDEDHSRLLERRPPEVDTLVDEWVLRPLRAGKDLSRPRRALRDAIHFGVSLGSEITCLLAAAPPFVSELVRDGPYPRKMTYRKLAYDPRMSDLDMLRANNPRWRFREDFDPSQWVFVFLHGYVDNTGGDRIAFKLARLGYQVYLVRYPFLRSVRDLAAELEEVLGEIADRESDKRILPVGHSLGGCIWDHLLLTRPELVNEYQVPLYIPLGSPHFGTLAAHLGAGKSAYEMKPHSDLVREHLAANFPEDLEIYPFVSRFDLLVLPIETALLKRGVNYVLSETGHVGQVIRSEIVTAIEEIIASPADVLKQRAAYRPFYPSSLAHALNRLPRAVQKRMGVDGILDYIGINEAQPPMFHLRVVRHELNMGIFPALRRTAPP